MPAHSTRVTRPCATCGHPLTVKASSRAKYCSRACAYSGARTHGDATGGNLSREYRIWTNIKTRCLNPKTPAYRDYGGRGIDLHAAWRDDFAAFLRDMGRCPSPDHTIERTDNDLGYSPENCRWATIKEQARNRRSAHLITFRGETKCMIAWAEATGLTEGNLSRRLRKGWTVERALTTPVRAHIPYRRR